MSIEGIGAMEEEIKKPVFLALQYLWLIAILTPKDLEGICILSIGISNLQIWIGLHQKLIDTSKNLKS